MQIPISDFNFQEALEARENRTRVAEEIPQPVNSERLKAKKGATLFDFIKMLARIIGKAMPEVDFDNDEGAIIRDPQKKLEKPVILYQVISREPAKELKARYSESLIEEIDETTGHTRYAHNYTQHQNVLIQFNVYDSNYLVAEEIVAKLEDLVIGYTGYFKANGIQEIVFSKYYTDASYDPYRQYLSVRSLQFFLTIEKVITVFDTTIADIELL